MQCHEFSTGTDSRSISLFHVIDSLRRDGTQRALLVLAEGLADRGYCQKVYSLNDAVDKQLVQELERSGVEVRVIGKRGLIGGWGLVRLLWDFRRLRPHAVQTFLPFGDLIGRSLARLARVPVVVSSIRARNVDKPSWNLVLDRMTMRWAHRVVFNSRRVVDFSLQHEGVRPEQVVYIPNGVRFREPAGPEAGIELRRRLGISADRTVLGTVGRLFPQKGHSFLLNAFALVLGRHPDCVLLVVGAGPLMGSLQEQAGRLGISDRVMFLGQRSDIPEILACMNVYVQASLWEGMSNAVMEAMAAGKPVVATDVDGSDEMIEPGRTGWLVPPGDSEAMAATLAEVLDHPACAQEAGDLAAKTVTQRFTPRAMVDGFDRLYRQLLGIC